MRKILTVGLLLVLVSCASFGKGNKEPWEPIPPTNTLEEFVGTWQQVNGATILTFKENGEFEVVNMEIGIAGWGRYGWGYHPRAGRETLIQLDHAPSGKCEYPSKGNLFNLNIRDREFATMPMKQIRDGFELRDFQLKAHEEFRIPRAERDGTYLINDDTIKQSPYGYQFMQSGNPWNFELSRDNLRLSLDWELENTIKSIDAYLTVYKLFSGDFVRVEQ